MPPFTVSRRVLLARTRAGSLRPAGAGMSGPPAAALLCAAPLLGGAGRAVDLVFPVVEAGEVVRRGPGQGGRHHRLRVLLLALIDLLVEVVLRDVLGLDLLPLVEEVLQNLIRRAVDIDALLQHFL